MPFHAFVEAVLNSDNIDRHLQSTSKPYARELRRIVDDVRRTYKPEAVTALQKEYVAAATALRDAEARQNSTRDDEIDLRAILRENNTEIAKIRSMLQDLDMHARLNDEKLDEHLTRRVNRLVAQMGGHDKTEAFVRRTGATDDSTLVALVVDAAVNHYENFDRIRIEYANAREIGMAHHNVVRALQEHRDHVRVLENDRAQMLNSIAHLEESSREAQNMHDHKETSGLDEFRAASYKARVRLQEEKDRQEKALQGLAERAATALGVSLNELTMLSNRNWRRGSSLPAI
jgi:hypothetical protein